jgi:hypothetical protein
LAGPRSRPAGFRTRQSRSRNWPFRCGEPACRWVALRHCARMIDLRRRTDAVR